MTPIHLQDLAFVIPTNRDVIKTVSSIPPECEAIVERDNECRENKARNRGIAKAKAGYIALCDDDIEFPRELVEESLRICRQGVIVGLEDYYPLRWVISRFMVFAKADWERLGGFDESVRHGAETDFCIRAEKLGMRTVRLPQGSVSHVEHAKPAYHRQHTRWLWYLWRRHPRQMTVPAIKMAVRKITGVEL
jgi:glycosyltransferase involved in cell wall biosynthesis